MRRQSGAAKKLPDDCVDLIYIDPPFNSNRNYEVFWGETKEKRAFEDRHDSTQAYIDFMRPRCVEMARVLKKTGSFYYHCDWHASHYVKVMLDQIFGENNFVNEIVWKRQTSHNDAKQGSKALRAVFTTFFFTTVAATEYTWNHQYVPLRRQHTSNRTILQLDEKRDAASNGAICGPRRGCSIKRESPLRVLGIDRYWRYTEENMEQFIRRGPCRAYRQEESPAL